MIGSGALPGVRVIPPQMATKELAGCLEAARENYEQALDQAWNEYRDELCKEIEEEMKEKGFDKE